MRELETSNHLLGDRAWYMPRWLDKVLPRLTIEPEEHSGDQSGSEHLDVDLDDAQPRELTTVH